MALMTKISAQELLDKFTAFALNELSVDEDLKAGSEEFFKSVGVDQVEFTSALFDFNAELEYCHHAHLHITIFSNERAYDEMNSQYVLMKKNYDTDKMEFVGMIPFQEIISEHLGFFNGLKKEGLEKLFTMISDNFE